MPSLGPGLIVALPEKDGSIPAPAVVAAPELPKETKALVEGKAQAMVSPNSENKEAVADAGESEIQDQVDPSGNNDAKRVEL